MAKKMDINFNFTNVDIYNPFIPHLIGDISFSDGTTYCWNGTDWIAISGGGVTLENEIMEYNHKTHRIISHCPCCGGPVTEISRRARHSGYQACEWCMSMINIFEERE